MALQPNDPQGSPLIDPTKDESTPSRLEELAVELLREANIDAQKKIIGQLMNVQDSLEIQQLYTNQQEITELRKDFKSYCERTDKKLDRMWKFGSILLGILAGSDIAFRLLELI